MRIKRIKISGYGPIKELSLTPGDFELIFGLNETGKTALVEILVYVLFKKTAVNLRYGKAGDVVVEIETNGHSLNLPAKKVSIELPVGDVANLMYVQASDSGVFGSKGEANFWDGVKSMLSKVGAGVQFTRLDEQVFDAVGLQPRKEDWKREIQAVIDNETQRRNALGSYLSKIGEIGKKEVELAKLNTRGEYLKGKLEVIEQSKGFKSYQEMQRLYNAYQEMKSGCQEYERYRYEYLTAWQKLDVEKRAKLDEGSKVEEIESEKESLEREIGGLDKVGRYIEDEGLNSVADFIKEEPTMPSLIFPLVIVLVAIIAVIASLFTTLPTAPAVIFLIGGIIVFGLYARRRTLVKKMQLQQKEWLVKAVRVFPDLEKLADLPQRIEKIQEEKIKKKASIEEKERTLERLKSARSVKVIDDEISELRAKTGLAEILDLEKKLSEKRHLENELQKVAASLAGRLHESDSRKWERMIKDYKVDLPEGAVDLTSEKDLRTELSDVQEMVDQLTRETRLFREVEQAKVGIGNELEAFREFEELDRKLRNYELEKEAAMAIRQILRDMSGELDDFITGLLHGDEGLANYFKVVTGRYSEVSVEKKNFIVADKKGNRYSIDNLSSGARDQLLLCFRMAALRKVYSKGAFLILDDAFIFADWQRRERLVQLLKSFVEQGNQVIYLTSDDHTRELFSEHGAKVTTLE